VEHGLLGEHSEKPFPSFGLGKFAVQAQVSSGDEIRFIRKFPDWNAAVA
jgi:hypothetical protein